MSKMNQTNYQGKKKTSYKSITRLLWKGYFIKANAEDILIVKIIVEYKFFSMKIYVYIYCILYWESFKKKNHCWK